MNNIQELQNKIEYLKKENQYLKSLLDNAGIPYESSANMNSTVRFDSNQGARILPKEITADDANKFFSMFWGRTDVYSKRTIKKSTGEVNYYTQCYNFWKNGCPRISGSKTKCQECPKQAYKKLEKQQIMAHLKGTTEDATDVIGIYPLIERSRSGRGAHLWIFFQKKIEASLARKFGNALLRKGAESVNLKSFRYYDRMLPMQDHLPQGSVGNLIALPLQGQALKEGNSAFIDENGYIKIPRGLLENIIVECEKAGIDYQIQDERCQGNQIKAEFNGQLKESQIPAVDILAENETGILNAATAFGKTVVCCNIIARKKVNTLILLQSSALMEQWESALEKFLMIDEELPEYQTPSGRKKRRKSVIGKLQGAHDSTTGIIDIAMVGSVCKKGEFHRRLKEYGLIIVDECHHAASDTIVEVLQEVNAKYVYGVTATPFRSDGLEKINYMLLGPIRYKYTSKDRAKEQGIEHLIYPRFTRAVAPRFQQDKMHPNEAYAIIRENEDRDNIIINDVIKCVKDGRTPVILSRYVDHSKKLYERLVGHADKVFLLSGENSKKEHRAILQQMNQVQAEESMILVATGKLIGEGFDFSRLDTLIMAMPVSWKSVVEQYAGRLNRDYEGKKSVIIYDYVDSHISMFEKMYYKRLKAYKQIGYDVFDGKEAEKQDANSIFDIDNYAEVYRRDLLEANCEIIISSPAISGKKVDELIELLKEKQEAGIRIRVVTWKPDMYGYGDSEYWMELQERMRKNGFEMNLVEDYCQHYCIIDQEVVWYGSMNFLGKEDGEDNLMRVCSKSIAAELLELTFGKTACFGENM